MINLFKKTQHTEEIPVLLFVLLFAPILWIIFNACLIGFGTFANIEHLPQIALDNISNAAKNILTWIWLLIGFIYVFLFY